MNQHEADMELAFAHARSKDKVCGICMEVVMVRLYDENTNSDTPQYNCSNTNLLYYTYTLTIIG